MRREIIPSQQTCNNAVSHSPAPQFVGISTSPLLIPRKPPTSPNICTRTLMHACMLRSLHECLKRYLSGVVFRRNARGKTAECFLSAFGSVCLSVTRRTGCVHVYRHGTASTHPQSPRIGRYLMSSLGAGLQRHASVLDSYTAWSW